MDVFHTDEIYLETDRRKAVVCQLARLGDLAQTLPLITQLSQNQYVKLLCDQQVGDWAKLLPGVDEIVTLDTQGWRRRCFQELGDLSATLQQLQTELSRLNDPGISDYYPLNDHPVSNLLATLVNRDQAECWLTTQLMLVRSYLKLIAGFQRLNRVHLADLWASLAPASGSAKTVALTLDKAGTEFAKNVLETFHRRKIRHLWAFVLGSGAKDRRLEPEDMAAWWMALPEAIRPAVVLIGSHQEKELADRFLSMARSFKPGVMDLIGRCSPAELLAVLVQMDLVIGVDTGPLHWAAVAGTRVLGLYFGSAGFHSTGPYGENHWVLAPTCPDYPCLPARAEQCQWSCRQAYKNSASMAKFLAHELTDYPPKSLSPPPDLTLYTSKLNFNGTSYVAFDEPSDPPDHSQFAQVTRLVLGCSRGNGHATSGGNGFLPHPNLEAFCQAWLEQINQLEFSAALPHRQTLQMKQAARDHLTSVLKELGVTDHDNPDSKRRYFEDSTVK